MALNHLANSVKTQFGMGDAPLVVASVSSLTEEYLALFKKTLAHLLRSGNFSELEKTMSALKSVDITPKDVELIKVFYSLTDNEFLRCQQCFRSVNLFKREFMDCCSEQKLAMCKWILEYEKPSQSDYESEIMAAGTGQAKCLLIAGNPTMIPKEFSLDSIDKTIKKTWSYNLNSKFREEYNMMLTGYHKLHTVSLETSNVDSSGLLPTFDSVVVPCLQEKSEVGCLTNQAIDVQDPLAGKKLLTFKDVAHITKDFDQIEEVFRQYGADASCKKAEIVIEKSESQQLKTFSALIEEFNRLKEIHQTNISSKETAEQKTEISLRDQLNQSLNTALKIAVANKSDDCVKQLLAVTNNIEQMIEQLRSSYDLMLAKQVVHLPAFNTHKHREFLITAAVNGDIESVKAFISQITEVTPEIGDTFSNAMARVCCSHLPHAIIETLVASGLGNPDLAIAKFIKHNDAICHREDILSLVCHLSFDIYINHELFVIAAQHKWIELIELLTSKLRKY